jgi:hypothetical protein
MGFGFRGLIVSYLLKKKRDSRVIFRRPGVHLEQHWYLLPFFTHSGTRGRHLGWAQRQHTRHTRGQDSSWESDSHSAGQEIPRLWWNPKVHEFVHESPPLDRLLSPLNPGRPPQLCFPNKIATRTSSNRCFRFRFPDQISCSFLVSHTRYMTRPSHPEFFHPNNILWRIQIIKLLLTLFSSASCRFIPLHPSWVQILPSAPSSHTQSVFLA